MSKKKLDISSITNELRGQSVFFPKDREEQWYRKVITG